MKRSTTSDNSNKKPKTISELKSSRELLEKLESLCKSNEHSACGKVAFPISKRTCTCSENDILKYHLGRPEDQDLGVLDPRYKKSYESLSIDKKITKMVKYLSTLVKNMRPHLKLDDPTNPNNMPDSVDDVQDWSFKFRQSETVLFNLYPKRSALAINIALASFARSAMRGGDDSYFNDAFLGIDGIDPSGSYFGAYMCGAIEEMLPFNNEKLVEAIQELLPDAETRSLLGPDLIDRVDLCAPMCKWINKKGQLLLNADLEPFDHLKVQHMMEAWDESDFDELFNAKKREMMQPVDE